MLYPMKEQKWESQPSRSLWSGETVGNSNMRHMNRKFTTKSRTGQPLLSCSLGSIINHPPPGRENFQESPPWGHQCTSMLWMSHSGIGSECLTTADGELPTHSQRVQSWKKDALSEGSTGPVALPKWHTKDFGLFYRQKPSWMAEGKAQCCVLSLLELLNSCAVHLETLRAFPTLLTSQSS